MASTEKNKAKLTPLVVSFLLIIFQGCSSKDSGLELDLKKQLIQHKTDNAVSIDLRTVFGTQWKKACLQSPYMFQTNFEKLVGENVRDYKGISDDRYTLWVFYTDGHTSRVDIGNAVMYHRLAGTGCTSFQQPFFYFDVEGGEKKYFFNDTGDMK